MKVGLFIPCFVDAVYPEVGVATLELLEKPGVEVYYGNGFQLFNGRTLAFGLLFMIFMSSVWYSSLYLDRSSGSSY